MAESEGAQVVNMPSQLTLNIGGATVDVAAIKSITWAAGTRELPREFKKGDDVEVTFRARVLGAGGKDKYDAHGNIALTTRGHDLRVDELVSAEVVSSRPFKTKAPAEPPEDE
jgi:hypothetical protein